MKRTGLIGALESVAPACIAVNLEPRHTRQPQPVKRQELDVDRLCREQHPWWLGSRYNGRNPIDRLIRATDASGRERRERNASEKSKLRTAGIPR